MSIIEIKGVKIDVDLQEATQIEHLKIGDSVKVLLKRYDDYKVCPGIIIGFVRFTTLPTIEIAYLDLSYNEAELSFIAYNANTKNVEIAKTEIQELSFKKSTVLEIMDKKILGKEQELHDMKAKKDYFLKNFGKYFQCKPVEEPIGNVQKTE